MQHGVGGLARAPTRRSGVRRACDGLARRDAANGRGPVSGSDRRQPDRPHDLELQPGRLHRGARTVRAITRTPRRPPPASLRLFSGDRLWREPPPFLAIWFRALLDHRGSRRHPADLLLAHTDGSWPRRWTRRPGCSPRAASAPTTARPRSIRPRRSSSSRCARSPRVEQLRQSRWTDCLNSMSQSMHCMFTRAAGPAWAKGWVCRDPQRGQAGRAGGSAPAPGWRPRMVRWLSDRAGCAPR